MQKNTRVKQNKKADKQQHKMVRIALPRRGPTVLSAGDALQLGHELSRRQQWPDVITLAQQLVQQLHSLQDAWLLWFQACHSMGDFVQLEAAAQQCLQVLPRSVPALLSLATALRMQQRHDQALEAVAKAVKLDPANAGAWNHLGIIQKELGQTTAALVTFNRCLALRPDLTEVYWNRSDLLSQPSPQDLHTMEQLLLNPKFDNQQQARLHYALARAYEFLGQDELQFQHVEQGARCKRNTLHYDHQHELQQMALIPQCFSPQVLAQQVAGTDTTATSTPIFICGLPRSGTTLVEQILSSHPEVSAGDELGCLPLACAQTMRALHMEKHFPHWATELQPSDWRTIGRLYLDHTSGLQHTRFFTDKNLQNYKAIGLIHLALPAAKMVYCRRDPMDTLWGCYRQLFGNGMAFSYDQKELAETWLAAEAVVQYWQQQLPDKVFVLDYEDLVANQEQVTRNLLEFIGLPWDERCLRFFENTRAVSTISSVQVRNPIHSGRIGQWRKFAEGLKPMQALLETAKPHD